jgi:hypothetical protein
MGITGQWAQRAAHDYTGATKWGHGYHPIHGDRSAGNDRGRVIGTKTNVYPLGEPSDAVTASLTDVTLDWVAIDDSEHPLPGEWFRYQEDLPRWGTRSGQFRDATNSPAMGEQPAWGVYYDSDRTGEFPRPGPTGGMQTWLNVDHGEVEEQQRANVVPTRFVSGGWLGKVRGALAQEESQVSGQNGFVWTINNASVQGQGMQEMAKPWGVARGQDGPRTPIRSRTAGQTVKKYGLSFRMGGGSGTPDMTPFQLTAGLKRPWKTRHPALPPDELHHMNTLEGRVPIARAVPPDAYQGDPEVGPGDRVPGDWGY